MIRNADETGVSGIGHVLDGIVFRDGTTIVKWCTDHAPSSVGIFRTFEEFEKIHIGSHPKNKTEIKWLD